jgi:hypothetical protein
MSERKYTAKLRNRDLTLTNRDISKFRDFFIGGSELARRMSELMWFKMYVMDAEMGVSPHDILTSIRELEAGEQSPTGTKLATQFRKPPLNGLWHKHWFSAHFLGANIVLGLGKDGVEKLVNEAMDPAKSKVITQEMINELAHRVTHDPLVARDARKKLTGEWIVFAKHGGKNYYLTVALHGTGDQVIFDEIKQHCLRDFPDLLTWMKAQQ